MYFIAFQLLLTRSVTRYFRVSLALIVVISLLFIVFLFLLFQITHVVSEIRILNLCKSLLCHVCMPWLGPLLSGPLTYLAILCLLICSRYFWLCPMPFAGHCTHIVATGGPCFLTCPSSVSFCIWSRMLFGCGPVCCPRRDHTCRLIFYVEFALLNKDWCWLAP